MKIIARNKQAKFNYELLESYEAGLVLKGSEIKSARLGKVSINEAYIRIKLDEAFLVSSHFAKFDKASYENHDETRDRKLLLNKREIIKLEQKSKEQGLTIVPISLYFKGSLLKLELALARGKKKYDKREDMKKQEVMKKIKRSLKN